MSIDANVSTKDGQLPYENCLIPNLSEAVQNQMRDIANFLFIPAGMLFAVLSLIANSFLLTVIMRTRTLQHPSQLILCSLSITDLLWGLLSVSKNVARIMDEDMCLERNSIDDFLFMVCYISTLGNLAIISRDRYIAVNRPLWYRTHITKTRVIRQAIAVWLFSAVPSFMAFLSTSSLLKYPVLDMLNIIVTSLYYIICILTMLYSYVGILRAGRRHNQQMLRLDFNIRSWRGRRNWLEREKKLASTVTSILLVLVFTFLPALILPFMLFIIGFDGNRFPSLDPFYELLVSVNGLLNPLLNFGRNKDVWQALRNLICCNQVNGLFRPSAVAVVRFDINHLTPTEATKHLNN